MPDLKAPGLPALVAAKPTPKYARPAERRSNHSGSRRLRSSFQNPARPEILGTEASARLGRQLLGRAQGNRLA